MLSDSGPGPNQRDERGTSRTVVRLNRGGEDEQNDYQAEASLAFDWIRRNANPHEVRMSLLFGTKKDHLPLQAADILAYEANKRFRDPEREERKAWQALDPKSRIVSVHFGKENMNSLVMDISDFIAKPAGSETSHRVGSRPAPRCRVSGNTCQAKLPAPQDRPPR